MLVLLALFDALSMHSDIRIAASHLGTLDARRVELKDKLKPSQKMVHGWTNPEDGRTDWSACLDWDDVKPVQDYKLTN